MFFESDYKILSNEKIAKDVYKMRLEGDTSHITAPGQFVNIKLDGKFLRRPISVCDCEENVITIIYKVVGEGTEQMSNLKIGKMLNMLTGLGNGYDISKSTKPLLIGGGVGVPQCIFLLKSLSNQGRDLALFLALTLRTRFFMKMNSRHLELTFLLRLLTVHTALKAL